MRNHIRNLATIIVLDLLIATCLDLEHDYQQTTIKKNVKKYIWVERKWIRRLQKKKKKNPQTFQLDNFL